MPSQKQEPPLTLKLIKEALLPSIADLFEHHAVKTDEHFKSIRHDIQDLKTDVNSLKADVSVLKTDVNSLKADVCILKTDVNSLKTDVSILKTDVNSLKADVSILKTDGVSLKAGIVRLESDVEGLKVAALNTQIEIHGMKIIVEQMNKNIGMAIELATIKDDSSNTVKDHSRRIKKLETEVTVIKTAFRDQNR